MEEIQSADYDKLSVEDIQKWIFDYKNSPETQALKQRYFTKSTAEIYGVSRKEDVHSNFLAWLFNPDESHGLDDFALRRLIDMLLQKGGVKFKEIFKDEYNELVVEDYRVENVRVEREKAYDTGRPDIEIALNLLINVKSETNVKEVRQIETLVIIENKVGSKEHKGQTERYKDDYEKKYNNEKLVFLYLTPISTIELESLKKVQCSSEAFIQINYQYIHDFILQPAFCQNISQETDYILKDYINALSQPALEESRNKNEKKQRNKIIMVLGDDRRELLIKFWDNNEDLIIAAITALYEDPNIDENTRTKLKKVKENIPTKSQRNTDKFTFEGASTDKGLPKSRTVLEVVKRVIEKEKIISVKGLKKLLPDTANKTNKNSGVFQLFGEIKPKDYRNFFTNEDEILKLDNQKIVVCNQWGIKNWEPFVDYCGKELKIEIRKVEN